LFSLISCSKEKPIKTIVEENTVKKENIEQLENNTDNFAQRAGNYNIEPGKYHILDFPVNVRSLPNLNGAIAGRLNLNDEIEVIENMGNEQQIEGVWQYWYKIKFNEISGYVWGGIFH
jgi:hypothetical protein